MTAERWEPLLERRRPPVPDEPHWLERNRLLVTARVVAAIPEGDPGWEPAPERVPERVIVATQVSVHPASGAASFQAAVVEPGRRPVVITESDLRIPGRGWELRGSGLWADHLVETPYRHWSYGLEAFALAIDDPWELMAAGLGERIALGWELEFECEQDPERLGPSGYQQLGTAHGLLLLGRRQLEIEGPACRSHRWGAPAPDADEIRPEQRRLEQRGPEQSGAGPAPGPVPREDPVVTPLALPAVDGVWCVTVEADGGCRVETVSGDGVVSG